MKTDRDLREQIISEYMGKLVHVVVDRPIGYQHGNLNYTLNYGYIPGLLGGDGEEQDAYILGVDEPVTEFDGQVIAVVRRKDDCEDKFVVAPAGSLYHQAQIAEAVDFVEQFFDSKVDSMFRKSCGVIPFRRRGRTWEYLILLQTNNCWSFPKGHMEPGETEEQTALRELWEETGLRARLLTDQKVLSEYCMQPYIRKHAVFFLGEVEGTVTLQETEVLRYRWVTKGGLKKFLHKDTYDVCEKLLK